MIKPYYYQAGSGALFQGEALEVARKLGSKKVQTIITSPPYFGLRDYSACQCVALKVQDESSGLSPGSHKSEMVPGSFGKAKPDCKVCGGSGEIREVAENQIGLEDSLQEYIDKLVTLFRELRRVLKDNGVIWINLGDSYFGGGRGGGGKGDEHSQMCKGSQKIQKGFKRKDLMMVPARVAIALCDDGWYLRSDITWEKINCIPEPVKDRPVKSHEHVFLLAKKEKYYYDYQAVREPMAVGGEARYKYSYGGNKAKVIEGSALLKHKVNHVSGMRETDWKRNLRSVWSVNTQAFAGGHFAVMPFEIIKPCILAGSKEGDIIMDPFMGSGTVALAAVQLRRKWLGTELSPIYCEMIKKRLGG